MSKNKKNWLTKHYLNFRYLRRHKYYVLKACYRYAKAYWEDPDDGFNWKLLWRGIIHDWSKLLPIEWFAYAEYFYESGEKKLNEGYFHQLNPRDIAYNRAWKHHQSHNSHHWQYWVFVLPHQSADDTHHCQCLKTDSMLKDTNLLLYDDGSLFCLKCGLDYPKDNLGTLDMPIIDRLEMLCDWIGAGEAQGNFGDIKPWWIKNREKIFLHPDVEAWFNRQILGHDAEI